MKMNFPKTSIGVGELKLSWPLSKTKDIVSLRDRSIKAPNVLVKEEDIVSLGGRAVKFAIVPVKERHTVSFEISQYQA